MQLTTLWYTPGEFFLLTSGTPHTMVLACRPEGSEALAQRVNGHKAEYERLQKAWREANLQAAPAFCSNLSAL